MAEDPKCDKVTFFKPSKAIGGDKPIQTCDVAPIKVPEELREPKDTQAVFEGEPRLRLISISNQEQTVTCPEYFYEIVDGERRPSEGAPVTVAAGTFTGVVDINTIQAVSAEAVQYIAATDGISRLEEAILRAQRSDVFELSAVNIAFILRIRLSQAEQLLQLILKEQDVLNAAAISMGKAGLDCIWWNETQQVKCPPDANGAPAASSADDPEAVNSALVLARTISSRSGQTAANTLALQQAKAMLNCFYVSAPTTASCITRPNRPLPTMENVVTDEEPVREGLAKRVGRYRVEKGRFKSFVSQAAADDQAYQFALSQLVCFYVNDEIEGACIDPSARSRGVDPEYSAPVVANPEEGTPGQSVTIPKGFFTSDISTEEANKAAISLRDSLLECCYINDALYLECPEGSDPVQSAVFSYYVPRGAFTSCVSKEEAEAMARASAEGALSCIYCNGLVPPSCVPNWVYQASTYGYVVPAPPEGVEDEFVYKGKTYKTGDVYVVDLPLDLADLIDPNTRTAVDVSSWSIDATRGMGKSIICGGELSQVNQIAENAARIPVGLSSSGAQGTESCMYKSTRLLIGCAFADPFKYPSGNDIEWADAGTSGTPQDLYRVANQEMKFPAVKPQTYYATYDASTYRYYAATPSKDISVDYSSPTPGEYIDLPEGLLTLSLRDIPGAAYDQTGEADAEAVVKKYADGLVLQMGLGMLTCQYRNPTTAVACRWKPSYPTMADPELKEADYAGSAIWLGDPAAPFWWFGDEKPEFERIDAESLGYSNPKKPIRIPGYNGGPIYELPTDEFLLPGSPSVTDPFIIPAGAVVADDYRKVAQQIATLASSLLKCRYGNAPLTCETNKTPSNAFCDCVAGGKKHRSLGSVVSEGSDALAMIVFDKSIYAATQKVLPLVTCKGALLCLCCNTIRYKQIRTKIDGRKEIPEGDERADCYQDMEIPECLFTADKAAEADAAADAYANSANSAVGGVLGNITGGTTLCDCDKQDPPPAGEKEATRLVPKVYVPDNLFSGCHAARQQAQRDLCTTMCSNGLFINVEAKAKVACCIRTSCYSTCPTLSYTLAAGMFSGRTRSGVIGAAKNFVQMQCAVLKDSFSAFRCRKVRIVSRIRFRKFKSDTTAEGEQPSSDPAVCPRGYITRVVSLSKETETESNSKEWTLQVVTDKQGSTKQVYALDSAVLTKWDGSGEKPDDVYTLTNADVEVPIDLFDVENGQRKAALDIEALRHTLQTTSCEYILTAKHNPVEAVTGGVRGIAVTPNYDKLHAFPVTTDVRTLRVRSSSQSGGGSSEGAGSIPGGVHIWFSVYTTLSPTTSTAEASAYEIDTITTSQEGGGTEGGATGPTTFLIRASNAETAEYTLLTTKSAESWQIYSFLRNTTGIKDDNGNVLSPTDLMTTYTIPDVSDTDIYPLFYIPDSLVQVLEVDKLGTNLGEKAYAFYAKSPVRTLDVQLSTGAYILTTDVKNEKAKVVRPNATLYLCVTTITTLHHSKDSAKDQDGNQETKADSPVELSAVAPLSTPSGPDKK